MKLTNIELAKRIEAWQDRLDLLGVGHFRIECVGVVEVVDDSRTKRAAVWTSPQYDTCVFDFQESFVESATAKQLDEVIIHEWLHVAMRDLDAGIDLMEDWMPPQTWVTFDENVRQRRETLVDRLARQIYALYNPRSSRRATL